ncbi:hypothetical protein [Lentzea albida]|uniref:Uncharacterized protein n=1 Tax=Lentzea albida TaxID=65499 RepID=A0A1H9VJ11_9PSEU|nr:hypothetical protein [Lentzea albida]SES21203.1 hypothetical protein SAMN04488000_118133 [Lentzea albida]
MNTSAGLCLADERHVRQAITRLPEDYVRLHLHIGRATSGTAEFATGTKELPVPLRLDVEGLQREIVEEAVRWSEPVAEACGVPWDTQHARDSRPGPLLTQACTLLADRLPVLLALRDVPQLVWDVDHQRTVLERDGVDGALRLLDLHHRAGRVLAVDRKIYRLPEPCPACGVSAVEHADGADIVDCRDCGVRFVWDDFRRRTDPLARLEEAS